MVGVFACEVAASLLVGIARRPGSGLLFLGLGVWIALRWVRRYRQQADAAVAAQIAVARMLLADRRPTAAWNSACAAAETAGGRALRDGALAVMIDVALDDREFETARRLVARMASPVDPVLQARIESSAGNKVRAIEVLERERRRPAFGAAAARRLVELHAEVDDLKRAVAVALDHLELLSLPDLRSMIASLEAWGDHAGAARLAHALAARPRVAAGEIGRARRPETETES